MFDHKIRFVHYSKVGNMLSQLFLAHAYWGSEGTLSRTGLSNRPFYLVFNTAIKTSIILPESIIIID